MPKQRDSRILGALENFVSSKGEPSESLEVRVANLEQTLRLVLSEIADIHIRLDRPQNTPKANVSNGTAKHSQAKPKQPPLPKQTGSKQMPSTAIPAEIKVMDRPNFVKMRTLLSDGILRTQDEIHREIQGFSKSSFQRIRKYFDNDGNVDRTVRRYMLKSE